MKCTRCKEELNACYFVTENEDPGGVPNYYHIYEFKCKICTLIKRKEVYAGNEYSSDISSICPFCKKEHKEGKE